MTILSSVRSKTRGPGHTSPGWQQSERTLARAFATITPAADSLQESCVVSDLAAIASTILFFRSTVRFHLWRLLAPFATRQDGHSPTEIPHGISVPSLGVAR